MRRWGSNGRGTRAATVIALLAVLSLDARAQDAGAPSATRAPNELGVWGGGSVASSTLIGKWTDFDFGLLALRYARNLWRNDALALDWTVDAIPLALISLDRGGSPGDTGGPKDTVYGAGVAPIGLRLAYEGFDHWRPYFASSVGFLMFEERLPATGTKFNYTWDFGVGAQIFVTDDQALTLGYAFHHLSNAYSGDTNPGFDSNILYAGWSLFLP
jgi:hypothetical protein